MALTAPDRPWSAAIHNAVQPLLSLALGSAPAPSKLAAISALPFPATAHNHNAVQPSLFLAWMAAPAFSRDLTALACPLCAACINGVQPLPSHVRVSAHRQQADNSILVSLV